MRPITAEWMTLESWPRGTRFGISDIMSQKAVEIATLRQLEVFKRTAFLLLDLLLLEYLTSQAHLETTLQEHST